MRFASDHPVLSIEQRVRDARALDLPADVLAAHLRGNAARVLLRQHV